MKLIDPDFLKINKARRKYWNFGGFPSAFEHNKYMEPSKILPQEYAAPTAVLSASRLLQHKNSLLPLAFRSINFRR